MKQWFTKPENSEIIKKIYDDLKILIDDFKRECIKLGFTFKGNEQNFLDLYN